MRRKYLKLLIFFRHYKWFEGDTVLWIVSLLLAVISILVVYSSIAKMAYDVSSGRTTQYFLFSQFKVLLAGTATLYFFYRLNASWFEKFKIHKYIPIIIYLLALLATLLAYTPLGSVKNGVSRWVSIGPIGFQPSEALKFAVMVNLSWQLAKRQLTIARTAIMPRILPWHWHGQRETAFTEFVPVVFPVIIACAVVAKAHFSSAIIILGISIILMIVGRVRLKDIGRFIALIGILGACYMMLGVGRSSTAGGRFSTWIETWTTDREGIKIQDLSDTERAMIAIHNGGAIGEGAGESVMRVEIIHPESDYVYALIVEEYGILFAIFLLLLYLWILFRAIEIFRQCTDCYSGFVALSFALMITCQALLHIMVNVNFMPETGQPLPLISRGGSSVLFTAMAIGVMLRISRQNEKRLEEKKKLRKKNKA